jgi:hypothetical protein
MSERSEALMRIIVGLVTGIILGVWKIIIQAVGLVHGIIVLFTGSRVKDLANFCERWNTQVYIYLRYMTFVDNEKPFPFRPLTKNMSKFEKWVS